VQDELGGVRGHGEPDLVRGLIHENLSHRNCGDPPTTAPCNAEQDGEGEGHPSESGAYQLQGGRGH